LREIVRGSEASRCHLSACLMRIGADDSQVRASALEMTLGFKVARPQTVAQPVAVFSEKQRANNAAVPTGRPHWGR